MRTIHKTAIYAGEGAAFLPRYFGQHTMLLVESTIYAQLARLCKIRQDETWRFVALSNGGGFIAPAGIEPLSLARDHDLSGQVVSSEAAGIVACLYAYSLFCFRPGMDHIRERYHQLREFAAEHEEAHTIFSLIN